MPGGPKFGSTHGAAVHGPAIQNVTTASTAAAAPTQTEYNNLVGKYNDLATKFNALLNAARSANLIG